MKKILLTIFPVAYTLLLSAQYNLVPNYSFEEIGDCPGGISGFSWSDDPYVTDWYAGHGGTSDYFNECAGPGSWVGVPENLFSEDQPAHTGVAYGGSWTTTGGDYREYVQAQLIEPLIAGECYFVEFWSAPATQSDFFAPHATTDAVGAYFSADKVGDAFGYSVLPYTPQIENSGTGNYIDPPGAWTKICGYFEAEGGEEWVCIGNYHTDADMEIVPYTGGDPASLVYLFIDDVTVSPADSMFYMPDTVVCSPVVLKGPPCANTYLWSTGETTESITVYASGSYWVQATTSCAVISDTADVLFVEDSVYTSLEALDICFGDIPYTIDASPSYDAYIWNTGETASSIEITEEGIYFVTGFADCATFIDTFDIAISESVGIYPELNDTLVCDDDWEIILSAPDGYDTYEWSTGETTREIIADHGGTYSVTVGNECETYSDEMTITTDPYLHADIELGEDRILCPPGGINSLIISVSTDLPNYEWNTGETTQSITIIEPGTYWVSSELLCSNPSDSVKVILCDDIAVPNAFSPNGDGTNDELSVIVVEPSRIYSFLIFNRWGQLVYDGNSTNYSWDGIYENEPQPIGTYVFVLEYDQSGERQIMQGNITLVR